MLEPPQRITATMAVVACLVMLGGLLLLLVPVFCYFVGVVDK